MIGGVSVWQLLILLLIVVLVFGTKRLRNIGTDLGSAVKGFRKGLEDDAPEAEPEKLTAEEKAPAKAETTKEPVKSETDV